MGVTLGQSEAGLVFARNGIYVYAVEDLASHKERERERPDLGKPGIAACGTGWRTRPGSPCHYVEGKSKFGDRSRRRWGM